MKLLNTKKFNLPIWVLALFVAVVVGAMYLGHIPMNMAGAMGLMFAIGIVLNEFGAWLPIWNKYIGGGVVMVFIGSSVLTHFNLIPTDYVDLMTGFNGDTGFLNFYIVFLICGSILSLERNLLIKSMTGYIPAMLGAMAMSAVFGILAGFFVGKNPMETVALYVLPIIGGGNGGGAVPLSQIWTESTGGDVNSYYTFAISILTIGNIIAIIFASLVSAVAEKKPEWTGDGTSIMPVSAGEETIEDLAKKEEEKLVLRDYGAAMFAALAIYIAAVLCNKVLPPVFGVNIHTFAYMVLITIIVSLGNILPGPIKKAATVLQNFFTKNLLVVLMVGVGLGTSLMEIINAITFGNVFIAIMAVIGSCIGALLVGRLFGFYPIDIILTAGLTTAARSSSGGLAVLGASDRMALFPYSQISTRIGGGIVLVIAGFLFAAMG